MIDMKVKNIRCELVSPPDLDIIEPLWEKIKKHHQSISPNFSEKYQESDFKTRKMELMAKSSGGKLRLELAEDISQEKYIGYCISSISSQGQGEIDSIFVEEDYRSLGIGHELVKRALHWMESECVEDLKIVVAVGNEELLPFYQSFGFYPRHMILENKK